MCRELSMWGDLQIKMPGLRVTIAYNGPGWVIGITVYSLDITMKGRLVLKCGKGRCRGLRSLLV